MIEKTFRFLPGIGLKTEQNIWEQGVKSWNDFLQESNIKGIGKAKKVYYDQKILKARKALREENTGYFYSALPRSEHWRLYDWFKDDAVFLDIETNGYHGYVTVIGLYDGYEVKQMVQGVNMDKETLRKELSKYKMIVTFNGSSFDVPVMNKYFNKVVPEVPHVDLRHVCSKIGLRGGLKVIEAQLDIRREDDVDGMSGGDAVMLWDMYRATGKEKYLNTLLRYNAEDIINLKPLAEYACEKLKERITTTSQTPKLLLGVRRALRSRKP